MKQTTRAPGSEQYGVNDQDFALRDLALLFDSCVTLGKLLVLSESLFSYSKEGNTIYLTGCWAVNKMGKRLRAHLGI